MDRKILTEFANEVLDLWCATEDGNDELDDISQETIMKRGLLPVLTDAKERTNTMYAILSTLLCDQISEAEHRNARRRLPDAINAMQATLFELQQLCICDRDKGADVLFDDWQKGATSPTKWIFIEARYTEDEQGD